MKNIRTPWLVIVMALLLSNPLHAQSASDRAEIRQTALDFIEGWYEADTTRMARSLHPDLISKVVTSHENAPSRLGRFTAKRLVELTARGDGKRVPVASQRKEVTILDVYQNAASVKVYAYDAMEYLHMAKWDGQWVIINILFERSRN